MRALIILGVVLSLPALAVLGHDLYMAYGQNDEVDLSEPFRLSYVGWLWETYSMDTLRIMRSVFEPDTWRTWIRPVLEQTALLVTIIPPAVIFAIVITLKVMRSGLFMIKMKTGGSKGYASKDIDKKKAPIKYSRK
ncbi:MAG: hypothetical protein KKA05_08455 [Alphaproteobacteria bacterium]|nr:hypothetical protein [Alphaproteobacteria bacterium]MBU0858551.1 hypothetical protein [Alphaproteobacteria bacterium]